MAACHSRRSVLRAFRSARVGKHRQHRPAALAIPWDGADSGCPAGYSPTTECHLRRGGPVAVPGFGYVAESYIFAAETATQPSCPAGEYKALSYSATITAKGRGELFLSVAGSDKCLQTTTTAILDVTQTFTVNGGSGVFAGASGSGTLTRTNTGFGAHGYGVDHWDGTLVAPSFEPDVTPPTITGASKKVVRAPRKARTVRVRYRVAATDDVDQHVTVRCKPRSGSRFKVPSLTRVRCSGQTRARIRRLQGSSSSFVAAERASAVRGSG